MPSNADEDLMWLLRAVDLCWPYSELLRVGVHVAVLLKDLSSYSQAHQLPRHVSLLVNHKQSFTGNNP